MALVGHVRGGLGYVTILAACHHGRAVGLGGGRCRGADRPAAADDGAAGHDKARSAGLIASAGIIAPIIPPSIGFVIFGVAANVSISKLFMAGIVPGPAAGPCAVGHLVVAGARKETSRRRRASQPAEVLEALRLATWALVLPVIVLVGLKMGVFTPTEAAVVAAVYAVRRHRHLPRAQR
jgi:tripartite ATP-independent transporter DctM subunit